MARRAWLLLGCLGLGCGAGGGKPSATAEDAATPADAANAEDAVDTAMATDAATDLTPVEGRVVRVLDNVHIGSDSSKPDFHNAVAPIDLGDGPFARVTLTLDLTSSCYPFEKWQTNRPPAGQNWPADCDAFDRNFEVTLDDPVAPATTPPAIELVRAITPFGGPEHLVVDITDVANGLPGKHTLRAMIPSYSDPAGKVSGSNGGWTLSASLQIVSGPAPRKVLAVVPLFNGSQNSSDALPPSTFTVPAGATGGRIEYRVTGHGGGAVETGCIGPAEEFCHRQHSLFIDDIKAADPDPWRTDCSTLCTLRTLSNGMLYCLENPCGATSSVRAPRANWCPGSITPPFNIEAPALTSAGEHAFRFAISRVAVGGTWRISAVYLAFEN